MSKLIPVFCYGSNNPNQLKERIGGRKFNTKRCYANNYKRVFRGWSNKWNGGVASIERSLDKTVYGYLAYLTEDELKTLDYYEGVPRVYQRQNISVYTDSGIVQAIAYIKNDHTVVSQPNKKYLQAIAETIGSFWKNSDGTPVTINDITIS